MNIKRVFLIVLDSYGIGNAPDAAAFGDEGANTLQSISRSPAYHTPQMLSLGLGNIDGVDCLPKAASCIGTYGRLEEASKGKDTTIGHWEIAGIISEKALPTYPRGFPQEVLEAFTKATGRAVLCNLPYSGTDVIRDYGQQHLETGKLIVYTSADSVFQIAAHEDLVPPQDLYRYCEQAREILQGEHAVGRVIARPFTGKAGEFKRTANRHDFSLLPPRKTMLDALTKAGYASYGIGKIYDIFAGQGISHSKRIRDNIEGMEKTIEMLEEDFRGLCFVNLVDFDMLYGHRNDVEGYARAASRFDEQLKIFMQRMQESDVLMITADHGCDPGYPGTDHSRECVPFLAYGASVRENVNLGTRRTYADIAASILDIFGLENITDGESFRKEMVKG